MERAGRGNIQELYISVLRRIGVFGGIIKDDRVEFEPFCVFHGKDHDAFCELRGLRITVRKGKFPAQFAAYV